jgi:crossover junction endodeoxyribonuclease RuvC
MRVLAIDPGYDRLGVAVIERVDNTEILHYSSCLETEKSDSLATRVRVLGSQLEALLEEYQPVAMAIETLFFNTNQKTAIGVAQMRGVCVYLATQADCHLLEYGPQEIKVAVTGYGKSDKAAVIDMVKRLLPSAPEKALDDEYDAIAVGLTALAHHPQGVGDNHLHQ